MRKHVKLVVLGLVAMLAMAFTASSASAITASPGGNITATSQGNMTFANAGGEFTISCPVTLRGTIATSITNAAGSHVGETTGGSVGTCNTGSASVLVSSTNSWPITFASTELASTPRKAELNQTRAQFLIAAFGLTCLYEGTVPLTLEGEGEPVVTRLLIVKTPNSEAKHTATLNSLLCPSSGQLRGTFTFTTQTLTLP